MLTKVTTYITLGNNLGSAISIKGVLPNPFKVDMLDITYINMQINF